MNSGTICRVSMTPCWLLLGRMVEEGPKGFEGGMSAKKYMSITGASKATATRDQNLAEREC